MSTTPAVNTVSPAAKSAVPDQLAPWKGVVLGWDIVAQLMDARSNKLQETINTGMAHMVPKSPAAATGLRA